MRSPKISKIGPPGQGADLRARSSHLRRTHLDARRLHSGSLPDVIATEQQARPLGVLLITHDSTLATH